MKNIPISRRDAGVLNSLRLSRPRCQWRHSLSSRMLWQTKSAPNKCTAIRILREANINPNLPNRRNKYPIGMLSKNDPRWKMLNTALENYRSNSSVSAPLGAKPENESNEKNHEEFPLTVAEGEKLSGDSDVQLTQEVPSTPTEDIKVSKIEDKQQLRLQMRENVASLIDALSLLTTFVSVEANEEHDDNEIFNEPPGVSQVADNDDGLLKDEIVCKLLKKMTEILMAVTLAEITMRRLKSTPNLLLKTFLGKSTVQIAFGR
ncbi:hypothetical protein OS493_023091 [Desmophyllum pertusum]|uniref:Uncharacterized protein n=1 Tax=Desmophyllum pertusum TaxID=174260 RepID=A0A9W9Z143_9CNID|nr:hypothetical protein OS493_023091 [Desmophyllum pertusum]